MRVLDLVLGGPHLAIGIGDAPLAKHPCDIFAAAIAQIRDQPDQPHPRTPLASITLKPSCVATMRTCSKCVVSVASYGKWRLATNHRHPGGTSARAACAMNARPSSGKSALP